MLEIDNSHVTVTADVLWATSALPKCTKM